MNRSVPSGTSPVMVTVWEPSGFRTSPVIASRAGVASAATVVTWLTTVRYRVDGENRTVARSPTLRPGSTGRSISPSLTIIGEIGIRTLPLAIRSSPWRNSEASTRTRPSTVRMPRSRTSQARSRKIVSGSPGALRVISLP